ncbi:MAG: hypothetical protein AMXMBFR84_29720 [Candidatus Hydrogenedentota bacterium]
MRFREEPDAIILASDRYMVAVMRITRTIRAAAVAFLGSRLLPLGVAVLGAVLTLPSLNNGYSRDDHLMRACFQGMPGLPEYSRGPTDTFVFFNGDSEETHALVDRGLLPWWTAPELKVAFWRPIASWLHFADFRLVGDNPMAMQAHSIAWYALLCALATLLFRRFLLPAWIAGLAAFLYAIDDDHGIVVGWLCNRNGLITACIGVLTILAHDHWRRGGKVWAAPVAYALMATGLLSGEAGIGIAAFLFSYTLFLDGTTLGKRILVFVPYAVLTLVYLAVYRTLGYGTLGSNWYLDPGTSLVPFLLRVIGNLPLLTCTMLFLWPTWVWQFRTPAEEPVLFGIVLLIIAWFFYLYRPLLRQNRVACFWMAGAVLSLVPSCAVVPHHRLTVFAGIGTMAVTAMFLGGYWTRADWVPAGRLWRINARAGVALILIAHIVLAIYQLPFYSMNMAIAAENTDVADASIPSTEGVRDKTVILMHSPDDLFAWIFHVKRSADGTPMPKHLRLLNSSHKMWIEREDERTLLLRPDDGFIPYAWHSPMRSSKTPMRAGDVFALSGLKVTVTEVDEAGWPLEARFVFDVSLDDPSLLWLGLARERRHSTHLGRSIWSHVYISITPPAIGERVRMRALVEGSPGFDKLKMDSGQGVDKADDDRSGSSDGSAGQGSP